MDVPASLILMTDIPELSAQACRKYPFIVREWCAKARRRLRCTVTHVCDLMRSFLPPQDTSGSSCRQPTYCTSVDRS